MCQIPYDQVTKLSTLLSKDQYNQTADELFAMSIDAIKRKDKIKVGFVLYDAALWSGDDLYHFFERNDRYEPTVFLCLRRDNFQRDIVIKDFHHGIEQFQQRGINVVGISDYEFQAPKQDVLMMLTPYFSVLPHTFQLETLTAETLLTYIPYSFQTSWLTNHKWPLLAVGWKFFWDTKHALNIYSKRCPKGMPRGIYTGYPKMDYFYSDEPSTYEWKEAQPNSIKIIWAPHWSINKGVKYATFQWNYKFIYEYARDHPETSWVVKPHPNLLFSAVKAKIFPTSESFQEYLQQWNDLPNAKVETGAYYYDIFKSSDAMIHDSGSFIAEYQYTHKPMLFIKREGTKFSRLGNVCINANYHVDGKDFDGIKHFIEDVLINKHDPQAATRQKVFDAELNYVKSNGMLASEKIFRSIDQAFQD